MSLDYSSARQRGSFDIMSVVDNRGYNDQVEDALFDELVSLPLADPDRDTVKVTGAARTPVKVEDDFKIGDKLGAGSYGVVYKAKKRHGAVGPGHPYAVKLFKKSLLTLERAQMNSQPWVDVVNAMGWIGGQLQTNRGPVNTFDPRSVAHRLVGLVREAQVMKYLQTANAGGVVGRPFLGVHDVHAYENPWLFCIAMPRQWEDMATVYETAAQKLLVPGDVAKMWREILLAIEHMHAQGILHLDLKLENVMITNEQPRQARIIDFGMCRKTNAQAANQALKWVPEIGAAFSGGTNPYMAPEVSYQPAVVPDGKADVWSVGVMFYLLLRQKLPFGRRIRANTAVPETLTNITNAKFQGKLPRRLRHDDIQQQLVNSLKVTVATRDTATAALARPFVAAGKPLGAWMTNANPGVFNAGYDEHGKQEFGGSASEHEFCSEMDSEGDYPIRRAARLHAHSHDGHEAARRAPRHQPVVAPDHPIAKEHRLLKKENRALARKVRRVKQLVDRAVGVARD